MRRDELAWTFFLALCLMLPCACKKTARGHGIGAQDVQQKRPEAMPCSGLFTDAGCVPGSVVKLSRRHALFEHGDLYSLGSGSYRRPSKLRSGIREFHISYEFSCFVLLTGEVECKGKNDHGQLGQGALLPLDEEKRYREDYGMLYSVALPEEAVQLFEQDHTLHVPFYMCAVLEDRSVWCWGGKERHEPRRIPWIERAAKVVTHYGGFCVLEEKEGTVKCGNGFDTPRVLASDVVQLEAGHHQVCARSSGGEVACLGSLHSPRDRGSDGDLRAFMNRPDPFADAEVKRIELEREPVDIALHQQFGMCALDEEGEVRCFKHDDPATLLVKADARLDARRLMLTSYQGCMFDQDQRAWCWSMKPQEAPESQPGNPASKGEVVLPARIYRNPLMDDVIASGDGCRLKSSGEVTCEGSSPHAPTQQITYGREPVLLYTMEHIAQVTLDEAWPCVLDDTGRRTCWRMHDPKEPGSHASHREKNEWERFISEKSSPQKIPHQVKLSEPAIRVFTQPAHACAIMKESGEVHCWGKNESLLFGRSLFPETSSPTKIEGLAHIEALSFGDAHRCALGRDGGVWCWGVNAHGQLGDGSTTNRERPTRVAGLPGSVSLLAAGGHHTCALTTTDEVWCWGYNLFGQVGQEDLHDQLLPVRVPELESVKKLWATGHRSCALTREDTLFCWGWNEDGQLGTWTDTYANPAPRPIPKLEGGIEEVALNSYGTCSLHEDGALNCWPADPQSRFCSRRWCRDHQDPSVLTEREPAPKKMNGQTPDQQPITHLFTEDVNKTAMWLVDASMRIGRMSLSPYPGQEGFGVEAQWRLHSCSLPEHRVVDFEPGKRCALFDTGDVACASYLPGDGTYHTSRSAMSPVYASQMGEVTQLSSSARYACGVNHAGEVWCWGYLGEGRRGDGGSSVRIRRDNASGSQIRSNHGVYNLTAQGKVERQARSSQKSEAHRANEIPNSSHLQSVQLGQESLCGLDAEGSVWCLGRIAYFTRGQDGLGWEDALTKMDIPVPITQLILTDNDACALGSDRSVWCWGSKASVPRRIEGIPKMRDIQLIHGDGCAVSEGAGEVWCWSADVSACLDPEEVPPSRPYKIDGIHGATHLPGEERCAYKEGGEAWCWQSGYHDGRNFKTASQVVVKASVEAMTPHSYQMQCALLTSGQSTCWQWSPSWSDSTTRSVKLQVMSKSADVIAISGKSALHRGGRVSYDGKMIAGIEGVKSLHESYTNTCGVLESGEVKCWGHAYDNAFGQSSSEEDAHASYMIDGVRGVLRIVGNQLGYRCALFEEPGKNIECWESFEGLARFQTSAVDGSLAEGPPGTITELKASPLGGACARNDMGEVWCWGNMAASLDLDPREIFGKSGAKLPGTHADLSKLYLGKRQSCLVEEDGEVFCWSPYPFKGTPYRDGNASDNGYLVYEHVEEMVVTDSAMCTRDQQGRVMCWGELYHSNGRRMAIHIIDVEGARGIFSGGGHICATVGPRRIVKCWTSRGLETIEGIEEIATIEMNSGKGACARNDAGETWCWGGVGRTKEEYDASLEAPVRIEAFDGDAALHFMRELICLHDLASHELRCWKMTQ